jgi:hypothetical protein
MRNHPDTLAKGGSLACLPVRATFLDVVAFVVIVQE